MNPGLPQGFVRFGTRHEVILKALHALGPMTYTDLMPLLGLACRRRAWAALRQLHAAGMIHAHGKVGGHGSAERAQLLWGLAPARKGTAYTPDPGAVRCARYRARKAQRVASVWEYRP